MDVAPLNNAPIVAPSPVSASAEQQAGNLQLIQAVHAINAAELYGDQSELSLVLDRRTRRATVRLVHRKTRQVIREIPTDQVLSMADREAYGD
jgi:flagellar protein FlaG